MNPIIDQINQHRSIRKYQPDKTIPEEQLDAIIRAAQSAPSWINGQQYSMIGVKEPERKEKLAALTGNPYVAECSVFLVFVADFYRVKVASKKYGKDFGAKAEADLLLVAATDVGLACQNAILAAESMDLGTVCIGGIRRELAAVSEFLELPEFVFPVVGLCLGYPAVQPPVKPRLPKEAVYFEESYKTDTWPLLEKYDEEIIPFSKREGSIGYTERIAKSYDQPYYSGITEALKKQGYLGGNR
ncbi:NADPH-dependent oxidoreductase [Listeria ilorinensis]|uniref:NADPH-dependent oxidoreductase n=1 Tax=Listeria ilorinensis TaxID=2867439 RepID=UPI001EF66F1E|nr:NADPH-dependent oxidoreductase [Listeria ilorinensis]